MFDPKVAGGFLAGQALGRSAGRIEEKNRTEYEIDVLNMTIENVWKIVRSAVLTYGVTLAKSCGSAALIQKLTEEAAAIASHVETHGSASAGDFIRIAPITAERSKSSRPNSRALMKSAALKAAREMDLSGYRLSQASIDDLRAAIAREVEASYS
jgi:hypothetical protein